MMYLSLFLNIIGSLLTVVFLTGHYLGMSPYVYMMLTSVITEVLYDACHRLPGMVLFSKLNGSIFQHFIPRIDAFCPKQNS